MKPVTPPTGCSAFALVGAVIARARELELGEIPLVEADLDDKLVSVAMREIEAGVITFST